MLHDESGDSSRNIGRNAMHRRNLVGMSVIATLALLPATALGDASGRHAQVQGHPDRPKFKPSADFRLDTPAAEFGETAKGFLSNFGTWSVNEEDDLKLVRTSTTMVYRRARTAICEVPPLLCPRNHWRHRRFSSSAVGSGGSA
jgi:hypothetical protein